MTTYNPDIGDLGSAAAPVAPASDRSKVMEEQNATIKKQESAQSFNTLAKGIFDFAPVANDIAAQKYIEKNLQGKDGVQDVTNAGFRTEKVSSDKYSVVTGEKDIQRRFASEAVKSLSGLEQARRQGLIGYDEMMVRAEQVRRREVNKAPFWADKINAAFRSTTGTATGVGSSVDAAPWSMTPEETAFNKDRELTAQYAAEYNVPLNEADRMRAEDAHLARQLKRAVKNTQDLAAWGQAQTTALRGDITKTIMLHSNENGVIDPEKLPALRKDIMQFEQYGREQVQSRINSLANEGILVDGETVNKMYADLKIEVDRMNSYVSSQDGVAFIKNIVSGKDAKTQNYLYETMPATMTLKAAGHDVTRLYEMLITSPDQFRAFASQNPEVARSVDMMTDDQLGAKIFGGTVKVLAGTSSNAEKEQFLQAMSVLPPQQVTAALARAVDPKSIYDAYQLRPGAVVTLKNNESIGPNNRIPTEIVDSIFKASARGINSSLIENLMVDGKIDATLDFVNDDQIPQVYGTSANHVVQGSVKDLYDTIVANPSTWKGYAESPQEYLRSILPKTIKSTLPPEAGKDIELMSKANDPANVLSLATSNFDSYLASEESVDAISQVLLKNARLARQGGMIADTGTGSMDVAKQLMSLEDKLWDAYLAKGNE